MCSSTDEWIKKMWHIHITEYYSVIKKNETCHLQENEWNLEDIILSEINQTQKDLVYVFSHMWGRER
jgi:hypothetical protein